jgi:dolichyl-phosphate-mannose-protein mannosyltransferase
VNSSDTKRQVETPDEEPLPHSPTVWSPLPNDGWKGWLGPALVTLLAGVLRFVNLGRPHDVMFDETYYAKDALALLRFGHERVTVDNANDLILTSPPRNWQQLPIFTDDPSFVVHPPVGKWVIATGEAIFGMSPFGWRFGVALLGTLSVLITARAVRRLTRSNLAGTIAGFLLAIDGLHLVMSRTALLDITLTFFVVCAFAFLLLDRDVTRKRAQNALNAVEGDLAVLGSLRFGVRPWRIASGVMLGLAVGTKWSGLWFVAIFGLLSVIWDANLRRTLQDRAWAWVTLLRDAIPAFASMVVVAGAVYVFTWSGWFATSGGYYRNWAATTGNGSFLPDVIASWLHYHKEAWNFHVALKTDHAYKSNPWSWVFMKRPTSFYYESENLNCGAANCSAEVLALGNPIIWWAGLLAIAYNVRQFIRFDDWRSGALLGGYLAGWMPWLLFPNRTMFTFYAVVLTPFLVGMIAVTLSDLTGHGKQMSDTRRKTGYVITFVFLLAATIAAWYFYPIWSGAPLPYEEWSNRMWLRSWI